MSAPVKEDLDPRIAAVEADYPGWHVFLNDASRWMAVRTGAGARYDDERQVPMTIDARSEAELRAELGKYPQDEDRD